MRLAGPPSPAALLDRLGELPAMPQVSRKALALIRDPNASLAQLAEVVALDQALAAQLLRWANSGYYMLQAPVATVWQAVVYLGQEAVQSLILTSSVAAVLTRAVPGYGLGRGELWKRSIATAVAARLATERFGKSLAEEAYYAGLLADVGKLALEVLLRNRDLSGPEWQVRSFVEAEKAQLGVDHAQLGADIARRWHLPDTLAEAIAFHHTPYHAGAGYLLAAAVHVGDAVARKLGIALGIDGQRYTLDAVACQRLGWEEARLPELAERTAPLLAAAELYLESDAPHL